MKREAIQRYNTAVDLIGRGLRLSIVGHLTGMHPKTLRALYRELHGRSPPSGPLPSAPTVLATRADQAMASVFALCYRRMGGPGIFEQLTLPALLEGYDLYRELLAAFVPEISPHKVLDINAAWVLARDITTGAVYFRDCARCAVHYLCARESFSPPGCPICALRRRDRKNPP